ncbi:hypothetical protein [Candidatus Phytoplasma ziziphi]|uniref:hypothetical protein n=1 Tax=Ziziphus jujuba witches'-broom phytoplasma TaxID=135727 RepID=UPI001EDFA51C|nr:hypothetical protein [Candidatus Phytoplasma ziziphi]
MQNIKKLITNYKKTFIFLTITLIFLISVSIYYLIREKEKISNQVVENKQITWNQNPKTEEEYNIALEQWKNQCCFQSGSTYVASTIVSKLGSPSKTGKLTRELYCLDSGNIWVPSLTVAYVNDIPEEQFKLDYCYFKNWTLDVINFTRKGTPYDNSFCGFGGNSPACRLVFDSGWSIKFDTYCDTTPPPTKPSHMR